MAQKEKKYFPTTLQSRSVETFMYGSETISSLGPKLLDILPTELKKIVSPTQFQKENLLMGPKELSMSFI